MNISQEKWDSIKPKTKFDEAIKNKLNLVDYNGDGVTEKALKDADGNIFSQTYVKTAIETTYVNFSDNLVTNGLLIPNQWYIITDYQTKKAVLGTDEIFEAPAEPILILAKTNKTVNATAYSMAHQEQLFVDFTPIYEFENGSAYIYSYHNQDGQAPVAITSKMISFDAQGQTPDGAVNFYFNDKEAQFSFNVSDYEVGVDWEWYEEDGNITIKFYSNFEYYDQLDLTKINDNSKAIYSEFSFAYYDYDEEQQITISWYIDRKSIYQTQDFTSKSFKMVCGYEPEIQFSEIYFSDNNLGIDFNTSNYVNGVDYQISYANGLLTFELLPVYEYYNDIDFTTFESPEINTDIGYIEAGLNRVLSTSFNGIVGRYNPASNFKTNFDYRGTKTRRYALVSYPEWNSSTNYALGDVVYKDYWLFACVKEGINNNNFSDGNGWARLCHATEKVFSSQGISFNIRTSNIIIQADTSSYSDVWVYSPDLIGINVLNSEIIITDGANPYFVNGLSNSNVYIGSTPCTFKGNLFNSDIKVYGNVYVENLANTSIKNLGFGVYRNIETTNMTQATGCVLNTVRECSIQTLLNTSLNDFTSNSVYYCQNTIFSANTTASVFYYISNTLFKSIVVKCTMLNVAQNSEFNYLANCNFYGQVAGFKISGGMDGVTFNRGASFSDITGSMTAVVMYGYFSGVNGTISLLSIVAGEINSITVESGASLLFSTCNFSKGFFVNTFYAGANYTINQCTGWGMRNCNFYGKSTIRNCYFGSDFSGTFGFEPVTVESVSVSPTSTINKTNHGLVANQYIKFDTTGTLPDGISPNQTYYVMSAGLTANSFRISTYSDDGAPVVITSTGSGTLTYTGSVYIDSVRFDGNATGNNYAGTYLSSSTIGQNFNNNTVKGYNYRVVLPNQYPNSVINRRDFTVLSTGGFTGINVTEPTSTLHANGSFAVKYSYKNSTSTIAENDCVVEIKNPITLTLPSITGLSKNGRVLEFKNTSNGNATISASSPDTVDGGSSLILPNGDTLKLIATSTDWVIIGETNTSLKLKLGALATAPSTSTSTGVKGDIRVTTDYLYACVDTNTWKRVTLSTW